jgi:hypothetical protein
MRDLLPFLVLQLPCGWPLLQVEVSWALGDSPASSAAVNMGTWVLQAPDALGSRSRSSPVTLCGTGGGCVATPKYHVSRW